jgi:hypothetical protein
MAFKKYATLALLPLVFFFAAKQAVAGAERRVCSGFEHIPTTLPNGVSLITLNDTLIDYDGVAHTTHNEITVNYRNITNQTLRTFDTLPDGTILENGAPLAGPQAPALKQALAAHLAKVRAACAAEQNAP